MWQIGLRQYSSKQQKSVDIGLKGVKEKSEKLSRQSQLNRHALSGSERHSLYPIPTKEMKITKAKMIIPQRQFGYQMDLIDESSNDSAIKDLSPQSPLKFINDLVLNPSRHKSFLSLNPSEISHVQFVNKQLNSFHPSPVRPLHRPHSLSQYNSIGVQAFIKSDTVYNKALRNAKHVRNQFSSYHPPIPTGSKPNPYIF